MEDWWKQWFESILSSLVVSYKLARVTDTYPSAQDSLVRRVKASYKVNEKWKEQDRAVQTLVVVLPIEEQNGDGAMTEEDIEDEV